MKHFPSLLAYGVAFLLLPSIAFSQTSGRDLLIRLHGGESGLIREAQVSVTTGSGKSLSVAPMSDGSYRVELPGVTSRLSLTIDVKAEGYESLKRTFLFSGAREVDLNLVKSLSAALQCYRPPSRAGDLLLRFTVKGSRPGAAGYFINDATLTLTLGGASNQGTVRSYAGRASGSGQYEVSVSPAEQGKTGTLEVASPHHETKKISLLVSGTIRQDITLNYNDYAARYQVDDQHLVETFGQMRLLLDRPGNGGQLSMNFFLPFGKELLSSDGRYPDWHFITNYPYREKLYHDILKEVVLQTTVEATAYCTGSVSDCVEELSRTMGTSSLDAVTRETATVAKYLGKPCAEKFSELWSVLTGVNILIKVNDAAREGTLSGMLLASAYERFQKDSYQLLRSRAAGSLLESDPAFTAALARLEKTLEAEQRIQRTDLEAKLKNQGYGRILTAEALNQALGMVMSKAFYLAGASKAVAGPVAFVVVESMMDMLKGLGKHGDLESSLLLLTMIDKSVLASEVDGHSKPVPAFDASISSGACTGGMMRLHSGFLINSFRSEYYSGKAQGMSQELLAAIRGNAFARAIIAASDKKALKAKADYRVLSQYFRPIISTQDAQGTSDAEGAEREEICKILGKGDREWCDLENYPPTVSRIAFEEIDLNSDGVNEIRCYATHICSTNHEIYFFARRPLRLIAQTSGYEVIPLTSRHGGYADLQEVGRYADLLHSYQGDTYIWDGMKYVTGNRLERKGLESFKEAIASFLQKRLEYHQDVEKWRSSLQYEFRDLNDDGKDEGIVYDRYTGGAQNIPCYVFLAAPFRMVLDGFWAADLKVLESRHGGYRDLQLQVYVSGQAVDPSLAADPYIYQWDGGKYSIVSSGR